MPETTFACGHVNDARSRNLLPAARITSATSKGDRVIPVASPAGYRFQYRIDRCPPESQLNTLFNSNFFAYIEDMSEHSYLGEFELMVLLTIIRSVDEAYGVPLSRELGLRRGREISIGAFSRVRSAGDQRLRAGLAVECRPIWCF